MPSNSKFTKDDDNNVAVRIVTNTGPSTQPDSMFTTDDDGNTAVRVVFGAGGGGDSHNLGYYETPEALRTAHPTATAGDFAIVNSTDTVWLWDADTSAWKDGDTKGQVTSVNNQTGAVTVQETLVNQSNIKSVNGNSLLGSGNLELSTYLTYPAGWPTTGTTKAFCDAIAADSSAVEGKAYLDEVTLSDLPASMANGEIVVEIMDGTTAANKVIVLSLKSGNVAPYAWQYVYWNNGTNTSGWKTWQEPLVSGTNIKTINNTSLLGSGNITVDSLPSQTGNSGKFLTTDGTDASWSDKPLVNKATFIPVGDTETTSVGIGRVEKANSYNSVVIGYQATDNTNVGSSGYAYSVVIGNSAKSWGEKAVAIGQGAKAAARSVAIGSDNPEASAGTSVTIGTNSASFGEYSIVLGYQVRATARAAVQIGIGASDFAVNQDEGTFKFGNLTGNYEIISANGTIPTDRFTTTPVSDGTYVPTLTISSGVATRTWGAAASAPVVPATMPTLAVADWSSNTQTVNVSGVTASNIVFVSPAPASAADYAAAGIVCTAQGSGTLTFTCTTVPSNAITVNVVILG